MTALLFALGIVALCVALIVVLVRHRKHKQDNNDIGVCIPNNRRIIDRYDIFAVLVGCVIGLILGIAMESGI